MNKPEEQSIDLQLMVVFELDQEEYAVPINEAKEVIKFSDITPVPQSQPYVLGVIDLRGKIIPVLDLGKRFGLVREGENRPKHVIITEDVDHKNSFGISVDQVTEVLKAHPDSIKPLPKMTESKISADFLKGVIVIEAEEKTEQTDRIILILDLPKVMSQSDETTVFEPSTVEPKEEPPPNMQEAKE